MLAASEEQIAQEWQKYNGYTVRPLPSTVDYYRQWFAALKPQQTCMLYGGTPEIRTLFQTFHLPVTMIDQSEPMVRAMGSLTESGLPIAANERFIQWNWLDTHALKNKYDFLIGDDAINMVSWDDFELFLQSAARLLNEDGLFVCHLLVKPDDVLICKTFTEVVREYHCGEIKSHYDLASKLNFICFDYETYGMGWQHTIHTIGAERLNRSLTDFNFVKLFGACNSHFYCPPQKEFENLVERYFFIEEIFYPHEHDYCLYEPVYILRKKGY
jgi:hypothetical protein